MTENDWKKSTDIEPMLQCVVERWFPDAEPCNWKWGERKKRLFVRACLERIWPLLPQEFRTVCDLLEPEADRQISKENRDALWSAAEGISDEHDKLLFALGYDDIGLLTPEVVTLARTIYENRAFDQMPLLADALEEAACHGADMLAHCRESGDHVRGCWVVDPVLGKGITLPA